MRDPAAPKSAPPPTNSTNPILVLLTNGCGPCDPKQRRCRPNWEVRCPPRAFADGVASNAISHFEPRERRPDCRRTRGLRTLTHMAPAPCCVLRLQPSRGYVTCLGSFARSQLGCGGGASLTSPRYSGFVDIVQMLRQNQRLLRANRVRPLRGVFHLEFPLEILLNRRSHSPLQRMSVIFFGAFAWFCATALLLGEPRRRALSVGLPRAGSRRA